MSLSYTCLLLRELFLFCITIFLLLGNKSHPASTKPQFSEGDPRLKYAVKKLDPRIHFALVCGAVVRREYVCVYVRKNCCIYGFNTLGNSDFKAFSVTG